MTSSIMMSPAYVLTPRSNSDPRLPGTGAWVPGTVRVHMRKQQQNYSRKLKLTKK